MARGKRYTLEQFEVKIKEIHGDNITLLEPYVNAHTKIKARCNIHNVLINQSPWSLLQGSVGCQQCKNDKIISEKKHNKIKKWTAEMFLKLAKEIHGDKYDYSKVVFKTSTAKVCIICPEHGEFWQAPVNHVGNINHNGCPKCAKEKLRNCQKLTTEEFIAKAKLVHGDKYDYSKVEYVNDSTKVCIICPIHGEFWQKPSKHINAKHGCPFCRGGSKANDFIKQVLIENAVQFESEKWFKDLKGYNNGYLKFDFYIQNKNTAIEFNGYQHYNEIKCFDGENGLKERQFNDNEKKKWCDNNAINLIIINGADRRFCDKDKENIINAIKFLWEN